MYEQRHLALPVDGRFLRIPNWVLRELSVLQHEVVAAGQRAPGRASARCGSGAEPARAGRAPGGRPRLRDRRRASSTWAPCSPAPRSGSGTSRCADSWARRPSPRWWRASARARRATSASTRGCGSARPRADLRRSSTRWTGARSRSPPSTPPASSCGPSGPRPAAPSATCTSGWRRRRATRRCCAGPSCAAPPTRPTRTSDAGPSGCCSPTRSRARRSPPSGCSSTGWAASPCGTRTWRTWASAASATPRCTSSSPTSPAPGATRPPPTPPIAGCSWARCGCSPPAPSPTRSTSPGSGCPLARLALHDDLEMAARAGEELDRLRRGFSALGRPQPPPGHRSPDRRRVRLEGRAGLRRGHPAGVVQPPPPGPGRHHHRPRLGVPPRPRGAPLAGRHPARRRGRHPAGPGPRQGGLPAWRCTPGPARSSTWPSTWPSR